MSYPRPDPATPPSIRRPDARSTLLGIQAARGVAALLVVLFHGERALSLPQYVGHAPLGGMTGFGHAGVDFFFVLSGFIIYYVHHADIGRPTRLARYAFSRATRIYPPYWIVTAGLLAIMAVSHGIGSLPSAASTIRSLLLAPGEPGPILGVAWTLVREMVFYVLFGLLILDRRIGALVITGYVAAGVLPGFAWLPLGAGWFDLLFALGIGAAWLTLHCRVPLPGILALAGGAAFLTSGVAENAGLIPMDGPAGRIAYGLAAAVLIVGLASAERAGQIRVGRLAVLLGAASYSIYLIHSPVLGFAARALATTGLLPLLPDWLAMALTVGIATTAGILLHVAVERPIQAAIKAFYSDGLKQRRGLPPLPG